MKYKLLFIILILSSIGISAYASGDKDYISIISGKNKYYYNRALEKELLVIGYNNNLQIIFNYLNKDDKNNTLINIIKKNVKNNIPISIFSLQSNEQLQTINNTIKQQGTLKHSLIDYTLVTTQFFSSLIFIDALPNETLKTPVPWGFIGYDIPSIVDLQLSYLRKTNSSKNILVCILDKDNIFESSWLKTLKKSINVDEKIFVEYLNIEENEYIIQLLEQKNYHTKNDLGILTLHDYMSIRIGVALINMNTTNNYKIVGFGGSPEARIAIDKNIIDMSIKPNYEEYGKKIIALSQELQKRKNKLLTNDYHFDTIQAASKKEFISVSTMQ